MKKSSIVLGTWSWGIGAVGGDQVFGHHLDDGDLSHVFNKAMNYGLTGWDSAVVYGMGASESILGNLIKNIRREDLYISTKFTPQIADETAEDPVADMLEGSLTRLGTDYVDMYWIHNPADVEKWTPCLIPLVKSGKVRSVGVSNHNLAQIKRAAEILSEGNIRLSGVQNHFSLLYRESEEAGIIDYCKTHGIDFWSYMVLEQGAISGKYDTGHPMPPDSQRGRTYNPMLSAIETLVGVMRSVGNTHGLTPAQVAISWAISKGTTPIIGVTDICQVDELAGAAKVLLSIDEINRLEKAADSAGVNTRGAWEKPMI